MADRSGKQLGNYRLVRLLGKGGFAEVYLGEHVFLKTPVAVKLLHTQLESEDMTGFLQEAQMIARLQHPHIVRVTDFGMDGDLPYLVMDFAPNGTLRHRHPRGTVLPLATILSYVKQIADALQYAHDEKLIHRDIKPENMLLARNNTILLSDFGIATVAHRSSTQNTQVVAGTAVYMAPESFLGKPYPASDQYALAIVVYEWLCGEPPFYKSDFIQLGYHHSFVPPEPLRAKVPSISKDVELVVNTALSKDPKQRFGSVQAFATALEHASQPYQEFVSPEHSISIPPPTPTPTPPVAIQEQEHKPSVQQASFASIGSYIGEEINSDAVKPKPVTETPAQKKENPWRIGKKQVVAMLIGTILYIAASTLTLWFNLSDTTILSIVPAIFIALYFGSVYGPWVGVITGTIGSLVSTYIPFSVNEGSWSLGNYFSPSFTWSLSNAIIGFITGIAFIRTRGHYNTRRNIVIADICGFCALLIASSTLLYDEPYFMRDFLDIALPNIVIGLILLPILLTLYNKFATRSKHI